jgi:GntR family transcriptional regulator, transcriptional repressor for pyruvate dehydrogenase complex
MTRRAAPGNLRAAVNRRPGRAKVTDEIVESLRLEIVTRRLKSGDRLPNERQLAEHFGVSQPTIREAIRALDVMGLVDVRHGSGAYVRGDSAYVVATALQTLLQIERVSIIDALDVREVLGRETARVAAINATEADLELIEERLAALDQLQDGTMTELLDALAAFQDAIAIATHNPLQYALEAFLVNLLLQLQLKALRQRGLQYWLDRSARFQADRIAIVNALRRRDERKAFKAMESYLEHQREVFLADPELSAMRLSDPNAVRAVSDIVSAVRNGV